eukprot:XP_001702253.1 predicted protein [Chlamydomonas reinhardtii]
MVATPKPAAHADDDYVPPSFPQAHLLWHIAKKGFQAGSFGGVAVSGAVALATRNRDPGAFLRGVGYGALAGTALSSWVPTAAGWAGLGAAKFTQITKVGGPGWAAAMVGGGGVGSVLGVLTHGHTGGGSPGPRVAGFQMEFAPDDGSEGANQGFLVPDWFFERTGIELKAQWQAARQRREEAAQLMTRAMRERQQQQQGPLRKAVLA